ncbi:MAG: hypothetical protein L6R42_010843 [Xanthoria sp. 1 TBL-2021]|nr:MAG: hypothetical protein L6R42_010843 [Xanthoria sp. 1 TBL-2021]
MDYYTILAIPIIVSTLWLFTANLARNSHPHFTNKSIVLLIAHPDDEAMFFSPTLLALTAPNSGNHVKILCLSNGNADGLGKTREKELMASGEILGLRSRDDILVLDSPHFVDGMDTMWEVEKVAEVLSQAFSSPRQKQKDQPTADDAPKATIDVLVTFDRLGVSNHPNHIALYHGAKSWLNSLMKGKQGWRCPVELHTLTSISILRKYISFLDAPMTMALGFLSGLKGSRKQEKAGGRRQALFVSGVWQWSQGQKAMTRAHRSQMRWFRWGWITFGRYMVVNDLKREVI